MIVQESAQEDPSLALASSVGVIALRIRLAVGLDVFHPDDFP